jgi:hypothetical protein
VSFSTSGSIDSTVVMIPGMVAFPR